MKVIIFDVGNGSCGLAVDSSGRSMMLDCGAHADRNCPVDLINDMRKAGGWLEHMSLVDTGVRQYPLTKLVVSHPDTDHLKNAEKVYQDLTPYVLSRVKLENYPSQLLATDDPGFNAYKSRFCDKYRGDPVTIDWTMRVFKASIPMRTLISDPQFAEAKLKNNSSLVYILEENGHRFLFCGDMEKVGWNWLIENNSDFVSEIEKGVDVWIASHHGHRSGYSSSLAQIIGSPKVSILSKASEYSDGTDVDSRYSENSDGWPVTCISDKQTSTRYSLTTRFDGMIYIDASSAELNVYTEK